MELGKILDAKPEASVIANQTVSDPFRLHCGTRQGCPLSPYIFTIAMEPLAISIQQSTDIGPITIEGRQQHLLLYTDDVLLFVADPETSVPPLLDLLETFGAFSGFTITGYLQV